MYNPLGGDGNLEFLELVNLTTQTVDLSNPVPGVGLVPWKITGLGFDFPLGTTIGPRGTLVIVPFDPTNPADGFKLDAFRAAYGIGPDVTLVGPYNGSLDNAGELIRLVRPDTSVSSTPDTLPFVLVDKVHYGVAPPWPTSPDGQNGNSLIRESATVYANDPTNWIGAKATPGKSNLVVPNLVANDFNFDGVANGADIQAMLMALTDLRGFQSAHTLTDADLRFIGDVNGDQQVTNADLQALLTALTSGGGGGGGGAATQQPAAVPLAAALTTIDPTAPSSEPESQAIVSTSPVSRSIFRSVRAPFVAVPRDSKPEVIPGPKRNRNVQSVPSADAPPMKRSRIDSLDHYFALLADKGEARLPRAMRTIATALFDADEGSEVLSASPSAERHGF